MNKVPFNKTGRIIAGESQGWYVRVLNDQENSGGYLILQSADPDFNGTEGFDDWLENEADIPEFFQECGWKIEWL